LVRREKLRFEVNEHLEYDARHSTERYQVLFPQVLFPLKTYVKYTLKEGSNEEKRELMGCFKSKIRITKGIVTIEESVSRL